MDKRLHGTLWVKVCWWKIQIRFYICYHSLNKEANHTAAAMLNSKPYMLIFRINSLFVYVFRDIGIVWAACMQTTLPLKQDDSNGFMGYYPQCSEVCCHNLNLCSNKSCVPMTVPLWMYFTDGHALSDALNCNNTSKSFQWIFMQTETKKAAVASWTRTTAFFIMAE